MSTFNKRVESKVRIDKLQKVFLKTVEEFSKKNIDLTPEEVVSVMITLIQDHNNKKVK